MLVRETLVIHSRLSWRQARGAAAIERQHGLQALAIEHVAARLAGGFLQPINPNSLKEAIGEAIAMDLGEFNDIKTLPGFSRAAAATLKKAWAAGLKFTELAKTSDALVRSRIDAVTRLEAEVLKRLPPSMRRPADLVDLALPRLRHAKTLFGAIHVLGRTEMSPVWRPFLAELKGVTDVQWVAGPRQVPAWAPALGIAVIETAPERPEIQRESCASPRHEALEAMRWARALLASGRAKPEEIAITAASPTEWDDHFQALSEMAGIDLHFVHGRKALSTPEGQLAAAVRSLRSQVSHDAEALCRAIIYEGGATSPTAMSELVRMRTCDVIVQPDETYQFAGVYSFGRGVFRGQAKTGMEFAYPKLTSLNAGNFVYPKLMAWEGALGVVPPDCDGCVVSTEFPVFEVLEDRVLPEVLDTYFRAPTVWPLLSGASTGTNVRRRRLNPGDFLKYKIPLPTRSTQELLRKVRAEVHTLQCLQVESSVELDALLPSILDRAFNGAV